MSTLNMAGVMSVFTSTDVSSRLLSILSSVVVVVVVVVVVDQLCNVAFCLLLMLLMLWRQEGVGWTSR